MQCEEFAEFLVVTCVVTRTMVYQQRKRIGSISEKRRDVDIYGREVVDHAREDIGYKGIKNGEQRKGGCKAVFALMVRERVSDIESCPLSEHRDNISYRRFPIPRGTDISFKLAIFYAFF